MIARILYRKSIHGVVKYVFEKAKIRVLGFQNTYSETDTGKEHFTRILHHLGGRHQSQKRYAHITLNLPHSEKLSDTDFYELSKSYMEHMGYEEQPFVVVRHFDTKHQHVHIVSTTVKEDGNLIDFSHDFRRNRATQKYLEKQYGLSPSPHTKSNKELPLYRLPELKKDDSSGVKFYIQDILNSALQKYKVRSFEELAQLVAPYHIIVKPTTNSKGGIGVSYGINIDNGYKSRFIDGYIVHPRLSGPKLQAIFKKQSQSKLLPMHKKRLEKQVLTAYQLFKSIRPEDLAGILKMHQKIDTKVRYDKKGQVLDFTISDKSGYVFKSSEISPKIGFGQHPVLGAGENGIQTQLDFGSKQLVLEVRKLIKNAFYTSYLNSYKKNTLSEFVRSNNRNSLHQAISSQELFAFLSTYLEGNSEQLTSIIRSEFEQTKNAIYVAESKREKEALLQKVTLLQNVLADSMFHTQKDKAIIFDLLQSLGLKYVRGKISYLNSNGYEVPLVLKNFHLPETIKSYVSTGFINQNEKVLAALLQNTPYKDVGLNGSAIFLPVVFPRLYKGMSTEYGKTFEKLSLKAYHETAERMHAPFEKSAKDYIRLFNAKGFYFVHRNQNIFLLSIYSKHATEVPLSPKTEKYLFADTNLNAVLNAQKPILDKIVNHGQHQLKNLWVSYLIEKNLYAKAAFLIVNDGIRPNLPSEILKFHMENGLREKIVAVTNQKINAKLAAFLRKSVYAFSALLGKTNNQEEEVFNGFRDELTDYGKFKSNLI